MILSAIQECIPVGCVPAAHWPYAGACSWRGDVCFQGGSALGGYVSALGGVCSGGSAWWDVCSQGGVWYSSMHWGRHPPPVDRITGTCKNSTLATTSLRLVTMMPVLPTSFWLSKIKFKRHWKVIPFANWILISHLLTFWDPNNEKNWKYGGSQSWHKWQYLPTSCVLDNVECRNLFTKFPPFTRYKKPLYTLNHFTRISNLKRLKMEGFFTSLQKCKISKM